MPETDYSKTIIYKIINYDVPDLVYVGSTTNLKTRKNQHKNASINSNHNCYHLKLYENIRNNGGWDCWKVIVICEYPCDNKRQAELEEDHQMMELKANLNTNRASRTIKQWCEDNKEKIALLRKDYYKDNRQTFLENRKQYYEGNKEKINEIKKNIYICECGAMIQQTEKARHIKTIKHQKFSSKI